MNRIVSGIVGLVVSSVLAGCARQTEQLSMQGPGVSANLLHGFGRFMLQNFISLPRT
jgi:hypothetical protein